jgi:hypothetical protein
VGLSGEVGGSAGLVGGLGAATRGNSVPASAVSTLDPMNTGIKSCTLWYR